MVGDMRVVKSYVALGLAGRSCAHGAVVVESGEDGDEDGGRRRVSLGEKEESTGWDRVAVYMRSLGWFRSGQRNNEKTITDRSGQRFAETPTVRKRDESGRRFHYPIIPVQCHQIAISCQAPNGNIVRSAIQEISAFPGNYFCVPSFCDIKSEIASKCISLFHHHTHSRRRPSTTHRPRTRQTRRPAHYSYAITQTG